MRPPLGGSSWLWLAAVPVLTIPKNRRHCALVLRTLQWYEVEILRGDNLAFPPLILAGLATCAFINSVSKTGEQLCKTKKKLTAL